MEGKSNSDENPQTDQHNEAERMSLQSENSFCGTNSDASAFSEQTDDTSSFASESPSPSHWLLGNRLRSPHILSRLRNLKHKRDMDDQELEEELMKERFAQLMLGGDTYGGARGECPALAVSNAITNIYASIFGDYKKLEPLDFDSKATWKREMNFLLAPCDHIVDSVATTLENESDGSTIEVTTEIPRADINGSLPALKILDDLLLEIMDSFEGTEIKYAEPAHNGEKWWHPTPSIPEGGLSEKSRRHLRKRHKSANQIYKAATALNNNVLADMDLPQSYIESLPKSGRAVVGDAVYNYVTSSSQFTPHEVMQYLNLAGEHEALEIIDKLEAAMHIWKRKASGTDTQPKSSWKVVKEFVSEIDRVDKNTVLAARAEDMIYYLKHKYPKLPQTTLDAAKIQHNTDMGKAILETYSRVLEGLAYKIYSMTKDVLSADENLRKNKGTQQQ